jgi:hypothetical protein
MLLRDLRAQLREGQVIPSREELPHPVTRGLAQHRGFPAPVGLCLRGPGFPLPPENVADCCRADPEQVRHFVLRVVVSFVGRDQGAAQVIRVGFHASEAIRSIR